MTEQEAMQAMQQLQTRQPQPPSNKQVLAAYVKAWHAIGVVVERDASNPQFKNGYATLEAHLKLIKPVCATHGLAILQVPGTIDGDKLLVVTHLIHESGETLTFATHVPLGGKFTAQAMGSATTYACRYVLRGLFGLAAGDDDGTEASAPVRSTPTRKVKAETTVGADELLARIEAFAGSVADFEAQVRPDVEALGNKDVNKAYVARRGELKKAVK